MPRLTFCGGAGGVTGACYLLEFDGYKILIDCGLFQGERFAEEKNHEAFPFDATSISHVCITHAHADHIGRLPKLYHDGFRGVIISTAPTKDLTGVMCADALNVMRHEVEDHGGTMLYQQEDVVGVLSLFQPHPYDTEIKINATTITLRNSAHILGSAMIDISHEGKRYVFTGDLGNTPSLLDQPMYPLTHTDYLLIESVYGDRNHEPQAERLPILEKAINETHAAGGTIMIPAFALERTQILLAELNQLINEKRIPEMPIYLDSPLAIHATEVYKKYPQFFNKQIQTILEKDDVFDFPGLVLTPSREDSISINSVVGPKIIIAGNPHGYGSRIAHHFSRYLSDPNSVVLMVGYQVPGSLGRKIASGASEVELFGRWIPIHAKIVNISSYSAHADQRQLTEFVAKIEKRVKKIFVAMGEPSSSEALMHIFREQLGFDAVIPTLGETVELE